MPKGGKSATHCIDCNVELDFSNSVYGGYHRRARCRTCYNTYTKNWKVKNKESVQLTSRKMNLKKYNLTKEEYDKMSELQQGLCAICNKPSNVEGRELSVDHDEESGIIRGLLCGKCNMGIGLLDHDIDILRYAIEYLEKHSQIRKIS